MVLCAHWFSGGRIRRRPLTHMSPYLLLGFESCARQLRRATWSKPNMSEGVLKDPGYMRERLCLSRPCTSTCMCSSGRLLWTVPGRVGGAQGLSPGGAGEPGAPTVPRTMMPHWGCCFAVSLAHTKVVAEEAMPRTMMSTMACNCTYRGFCPLGSLGSRQAPLQSGKSPSSSCTSLPVRVIIPGNCQDCVAKRHGGEWDCSSVQTCKERTAVWK